MHIFFLHQDPNIAASSLNDDHVMTAPVTIANVVSTVHRLFPTEQIHDQALAKSHVNNDTIKWASESTDNYLWAVKYGIAACEHRILRFNKPYGKEELIKWGLSCLPARPTIGITPPPRPAKSRADNAIIDYRKHYIYEYRHSTWTGVVKPLWHVLDRYIYVVGNYSVEKEEAIRSAVDNHIVHVTLDKKDISISIRKHNETYIVSAFDRSFYFLNPETAIDIAELMMERISEGRSLRFTFMDEDIDNVVEIVRSNAIQRGETYEAQAELTYARWLNPTMSATSFVNLCSETLNDNQPD